MIPNEIFFEIFSYMLREELGRFLILSKSVREIIIDVLKSKIYNYYNLNIDLSIIELQRYR